MGIFFNRKTKYERRTVRLKGKKFRVDIADSFGKIMRGLSGRGSIAADGGMLFLFKNNGKYGFWMNGMKFSIDIIWLDEHSKVVHIWSNAEPCTSIFACRTVKPERDSRYVLELRAGMAKKLGIKTGDRLDLGA
jgi:uncharacterized membrane protein (UPF0127 family)